MVNRNLPIENDVLIVGIDIAKYTHWAQFTDIRGNTLRKPLRVENTVEGFATLYSEIGQLCEKYDFKHTTVGFEPSGHYWRNLAWYLKTSEGVGIVGVNPYHVKQLKELEDNSQTKNDKKDALVIAHLIRDGRTFEIYMPEDEYADLRV